MIRFPLLCSAVASLVCSGCNSPISPGDGEPTGLAADVAQKAQEVVQQIGGPNGFGGPFVEDYYEHMAQHMGFHGPEYLADPDGDLVFELTNDSSLPCTFHLAYIESSAGLEEQYEDIVVTPGDTVEVELPCAEIVGVGGLTDVGTIAGELADGTVFDNRWCVPGFLNSDYACGGVYACALAPDTNDLDQEGDTEELIMVTSGLQLHMREGGMGTHMWSGNSSFDGMMGGWPGSIMGGTRR